MPLPRVAIVGRPNVGKSSIMNMLARDKISIVDPTAGTTRDRVTALVTLDPPLKTRSRRKHDDETPDLPPIRVEVTDTGGYGVYVSEGGRFNEVGADLASLTHDIEFQISQAVASADLVLFVVDAQQGVTPQDEQVARLLRERVLGNKDKTARTPPIQVVANKVDGPKWEAHAAEAANLGLGDVLNVGASNNYMRREFVDALYALVAALDLEQPEPGLTIDPAMRLAIVGKRNAGKSSLVNALAGEKRVIVSEIAGTTRDAVDVRFELDGKAFIAIDTAGLRKKKSFADRIEWYAYDRAQGAIERADVGLLLIDATEPISQVDQQIAMLLQKSYKPVVIVVNKWDMAEGKRDPHGKPITPETYETYLRRELKGLWYAPIALVSAAAGLNIRPTIHLAFDLYEQARQRVTTGKLNRLLRKILDERGPPSKLGTFAKLYYVAQIGVNPPTIGMVVNKPELFTNIYQRFLLNRIREESPFSEVPIKLLVNGRKREGTIAESVEEMTARAERDDLPSGVAAFEGFEAETSPAEPQDPDAELAGAGDEGEILDAEAYFDEES
jgi:GTP-binding protein